MSSLLIQQQQQLRLPQQPIPQQLPQLQQLPQQQLPPLLPQLQLLQPTPPPQQQQQQQPTQQPPPPLPRGTNQLDITNLSLKLQLNQLRCPIP